MLERLGILNDERRRLLRQRRMRLSPGERLLGLDQIADDGAADQQLARDSRSAVRVIPPPPTTRGQFGRRGGGGNAPAVDCTNTCSYLQAGAFAQADPLRSHTARGSRSATGKRS